MTHGRPLELTVSTFQYLHWRLLTIKDRPLRVPPEAAEEAGISQDQVKISDKYGGGFPANLEGLHHLHCLVILTTPMLCVSVITSHRTSFANHSTTITTTIMRKARALL